MLYVNYITIKLEMLKKAQTTHSSILGLPLWLSWLRICLQCRRPGFSSWVGKIPWRRERLPTPVFWPGEFHGLYSSWGCKELDTTEWFSLTYSKLEMGFPGGKESACNAGDPDNLGSIPGSGRYPGEENGNPLQYSCLGNPMDRGAWWSTVREVTKKLDMIEHLTHKAGKIQ